ncbi:hypothetical protein RvY_10040 [Ramazzottius varieornatus]|uniref:glutathione transferase n=1 Tax=Ramazzottius varieornatus TaxID=947166 RepID=A0A1D1VJ81_RAMVA|nr:hypothetical protein RvY_10040 [Ramazzottius varieornatus]
MGSPVTLYYFDGRGRGEVIRWILHAAGQNFKDERVDHAEWVKNPQMKTKSPLGQLPYIEVNGKTLGQSHAIGRYLARQHGLAGKDAWEEAEVDALVDFTEDIYKGWINWLHAKMENDPKVDDIRKQFLTADIVPYLQQYETILGRNKSGYLVGQGPTWADFTAVGFLDELVLMDQSILTSHPELQEYVDRVHNLKGIKEWLAKRQKTEF